MSSLTPALLDRSFVHGQLERLHAHLSEVGDAPRLTGMGIEHPAELVRATRRSLEDALGESASGDYYSRNPLVSVVQSTLDQALAQKLMTGEVEVTDERLTDPFAPHDYRGWIGDIALSMVARLIAGSHPFTDVPATGTLEPNARLILMSDWGTGREGAAAVARAAGPWVHEPGCTRSVHVVHLGDTYYSGTPSEQQHNLLTPWPVATADARDVVSWNLNGNHDMYSGGFGLFQTVLGDPRFARQQAGGRPTTWLELINPDWTLLGLDTAWNPHVVELVDGELQMLGWEGHLPGQQAKRLSAAAEADRRLLVLSHHQAFVAYEGTGETRLGGEVADALGGREVDVWFWGHEHDCLAYGPREGIRAARAIGHGGVPELLRKGAYRPIGDGPLAVPDVSADVAPDHPSRDVVWEYRGHRRTTDGQLWKRHGFAVADLDGARLRVRYVDDRGTVFHEEVL